MTTSERNFFGREELLARLSTELHQVSSSSSGRMIGLRGRRQIGKSTAVEKFVEDTGTPYVFTTGIRGSSHSEQLARAGEDILRSRHPLHAEAGEPPRTWREWFREIEDAARTHPVIVVMDEFPWMGQSAPSLESELQTAWDRHLERLPVLLILVGSDVSLMDRLVEYDRPLYGRLALIPVEPLNPAEVASALPEFSAFEQMDAYLVTGGYPRLVADIVRSGAPSTRDYVKLAFQDAYSPLLTVGRLSLASEFPESHIAYQVLAAAGANDVGHASFKNMLAHIGDSGDRANQDNAVARALRMLTDIKGLLVKEVPAWASPKTNVRRYRIADPYLRFWFRYIERRHDDIARGRADLAVEAFERDWESWRGRTVEPVVRRALDRIATRDERLRGVERVEAWWTRDGSVEVDAVGQTRDHTAFVGSIKWRERSSFEDKDLRELVEHRTHVPRAENSLLAAVCPDGTAPQGADLVFSADDIVAAWR